MNPCKRDMARSIRFTTDAYFLKKTKLEIVERP